jgi:hypothetical protein
MSLPFVSAKHKKQEKKMTKYNAAVLGAAGGIGQPLSLLLAMSPYVKKLSTCK